MFLPDERQTVPRAHLRFGKTNRHAQLRFSICSLFVLTALAAVLVVFLKGLFPAHWPVVPLLALVPPLLSACLLLSATGGQVWKGILLGALAGLGIIFFQDEFIVRHWRPLIPRNDYLGFVLEFFYTGVFLKFALSTVVGGCINAIQKRFVTLGIYALFATFLYGVTFVLYSIGTVFTRSDF